MAREVAPATAGVARINLLPRSEVQRRERDRLTRAWLWGVFAAIVVALLIIAGAFWLKTVADARLAAEQAETSNLILELSSLSAVSSALAAERELTDFRSIAMAPDLAWTPVVGSVVSVLPPGAILTGFDVATGGAPQADDPTLETGLTGRFWVSSGVPVDIVSTIRALRGVDAVIYADGQSITQDGANQGSYAYELNVTFDQTIYSGAYATDEEGGN